jgi:hypothetical protein
VAIVFQGRESSRRGKSEEGKTLGRQGCTRRLKRGRTLDGEVQYIKKDKGGANLDVQTTSMVSVVNGGHDDHGHSKATPAAGNSVVELVLR